MMFVIIVCLFIFDIYSESNTKVATEILQSVRNFIASYPFDFKPEQARIISGDVEGVSGWITINYLLDNFFPSSVRIGLT